MSGNAPGVSFKSPYSALKEKAKCTSAKILSSNLYHTENSKNKDGKPRCLQFQLLSFLACFFFFFFFFLFKMMSYATGKHLSTGKLAMKKYDNHWNPSGSLTETITYMIFQYTVELQWLER